MRYPIWILVLAMGMLGGNATGWASEALRFDFSPSPLAERLEAIERSRKLVETPRCQQPPKIDGLLDDAAWQGAAVIEIPGGRGGIGLTRARVCYDNSTIYFGIHCAGVPSEMPAAKGNERDDPDIFRTDHLELFFAAKNDGTIYQFAVDVRGLRYDGTRAGGSDDFTYNPSWKCAVRREADHWTAEAAIPRAALGSNATAAQIGFDLARGVPGSAARSWVGRLGNCDGGALMLKGLAENAKTAQGVERGIATSLDVALSRPYARPGERWIETRLKLHPGKEPLPALRVAAAVFGFGDDKPMATLAATPTLEEGQLLVDLRSLGLKAGRVRVELREGNRRLSVWESMLTAQEAERPPTAGTRIAVTVDTPTGLSVRGYPVTFGVPFPAGSLWDPGKLRLVDGAGRGVAAQREVTGRWAPEGAIRWARFDALVDSGQKYFVEMGGAPVGAQPAGRLTLAEAGEKITMDTGTARYVLTKGKSPIAEVWLKDRRIATSDAPTVRGLYVVDQQGRVASASADGEKMEIERSGPIAGCVRFEGFYATGDGIKLARHITRVEGYAGQAFARVTHTLVLTNDTNDVWFKEIGWELAADAGEHPQAVFGTSRDDFGKNQALPLASDDGVSMLQDQHYRFGAGRNHFAVMQRAAGKQATFLEGEECGDYAALIGRSGGLLVACKEAARQHPKEFRVSPTAINLCLFSGAAGEELDFRMPTLVKKWNLAEWVEKTLSPYQRKRAGEQALEKVANYASDAAGWAKTHDLLIAPLSEVQPAPELARLNREGGFAQADPAWLCASGTFDRIHPRDRQGFPREEQLIDATLDVWYQRMYGGWGLYGFVDYNAGPVLEYLGDEIPRLYRFVRSTYSLRSDLWLQYARSGDRRTREFAAVSNRAYFDNVYSHWDHKKKVAGLPTSAGDGDEYPAKGSLPLYWGEIAQTNLSSASNLNQVSWDYYLTGSGRARDQMLEYAEGIKKYWTPDVARRDWRQLMLMRLLMQCYEFTWDPELLALAEATTDAFYDSEGELLLSKNRPYHSTSYKTQVDVAGLLDAWRITGQQRYYDMILRVSNYWWKTLLGVWPIFYFNPQGRIGQFLYDQMGDPSYPQGLLIQMRQAATAFNPETGKVIASQEGRIGAEDASFVFSGIPFAQEVVVRADRAGTPGVAWAGWDDFGGETCLYVTKGDMESLTVQMKSTGADSSGTKIESAGIANAGGEDQFYAKEQGGGEATFHIAKDAPAGCYRLRSGHKGEHFALASRAAQMVLYAPGYWQPRPKMAPAARWYFTIPADARRPQIYFDGPAMVYEPSGKPIAEKPLPGGWTELAGERPGLWSFEMLGARLVRVHNLPPVFAAGTADSFFMPPMEWVKDAPPMELAAIPTGTQFIPGAGSDRANQAVYLDANRTFALDGGTPRADGRGTQFLPFPEGTVEFFVRPSWDVADLPDGTGYLLYLLAEPEKWSLGYMKDSTTESWRASHCLYGYFMTDGRDGRRSMRDYRRTVFEPGRWTHVAWTWGPKDYTSMVSRNRGRGVTTAIYVDGRAAQQYTYPGAGTFPSDLPKSLLLMNVASRAKLKDRGTAYDELRVSDVMRYTGDFTPPSPDERFKLDERTRALFHFDGNLEGESGTSPGKVTGSFSKR